MKLSEFVTECRSSLSNELAEQLNTDTAMLSFKTTATVSEAANALKAHLNEGDFTVDENDKSITFTHRLTGVGLKVYRYGNSIRIIAMPPSKKRIGHGHKLKGLLNL